MCLRYTAVARVMKRSTTSSSSLAICATTLASLSSRRGRSSTTRAPEPSGRPDQHLSPVAAVGRSGDVADECSRCESRQMLPDGCISQRET